ncbi:hypothetical protein YPPY46_1519 [Yersinia pestis PY-46]|uniref:Uncharacterized protein n=2 Tax=Yersinia pseudotuberculosis complex TaxID=1649845 RepID=A0A0U1QWQ5_YERP3|nr:hypothetical protein YpsIP31758_2700 [Yersinia pseudotuberculosis IP 31758]EDR34541.1 hypothetical protein YPIP275_4766 [Yersinia pestis biovar Orientalis str. IP275]EDR43449.1 hypothetical protein YpE1979001_2536 [Yersinia pestis biovar Antiqua str. E1979001]EDR51589.1 hypothetical protein YpB42003004_2301 [Yersinia pestis biovar Antiqua str. B42003004]EDR58359.1 hypothetical protein YpMG051020_0645 [Yersinia pestis biovar Orientalis str. MG05-1020]EDR66914.1 hypothetical protein YpK197300
MPTSVIGRKVRYRQKKAALTVSGLILLLLRMQKVKIKWNKHGVGMARMIRCR